jgi:hypothetical protein
MLSAIQGVLNSICEIADRRYSEGGLSYSYSYFHNTAHCRLDRTIVGSSNFIERNFDTNEIDALSTLIERAINDANAEVISVKTRKYSSTLVNAINQHFKGNFTKVVSNVYDGCSHNIIIESVNSCNGGHQIDIFWSLD